ncbi:hypothetical protein ACFLZX_02410 [Nanoarchaeota archaeon]
MKSRNIIIVMLALIFLAATLYLSISHYTDPYLGSHIVVSEITNNEGELAYRPFENEDRGAMHVQINNVSTKRGLTIMLSFLSLLMGLPLQLFYLLPLGSIMVFLTAWLFIRRILDNNIALSLLVALLVVLEVSNLGNMFNLNTHAWGFSLLFLIMYYSLNVLENVGNRFANLFVLVSLILSLTMIYYSLQFVVFLIFAVVIGLGFFERKKTMNTTVINTLLILLGLVVVFSFFDDFFIKFVTDMFLNTTNLFNWIDNFIHNFLNTINIFGGSYTQSAGEFALTNRPMFTLYLGFFYYLVLSLFVLAFIVKTYPKLRKGTILVKEKFLLALIIVSVLHFFIYLYLNQFVAYLALLLMPIVVFYTIKNYLPKKVLLTSVIIVLVLMKLFFNLYFDPIYQRADYASYDSMSEWAKVHVIQYGDHYSLADLYMAESILVHDQYHRVKGFYFLNKGINNFEYLYYPSEYLTYKNLDKENINYIFISDVNKDKRVPLMYGISILFKPFGQVYLEDYERVNKVYSSDVGSVYNYD